MEPAVVEFSDLSKAPAAHMLGEMHRHLPTETGSLRIARNTANQNDPAGRFLLHILGAAAEFERSLIKDRVHAGLKQAKIAGKRLGRPKAIFSRDEVRRLRFDEGLSIRQICVRLDLSIGTVSRTLEEAA